MQKFYIEKENERGQYFYKQETMWKDGVKYDVDILAFHLDHNLDVIVGLFFIVLL